MTASGIQPPGSPPGLSGSKSSKSSSFHSSSYSGADGTLSDITHFEDIGLDEDSLPLNQELYYTENLKPPTPRLDEFAMSGTRSPTASIAPTRELVNSGKRPSYPSLQGQVKDALGKESIQTLNLPSRRGTRRRSPSPSRPSLAMKAMSNLTRSRSPSPSPLHPLHTPTQPRPIPSPNLAQPLGMSPVLGNARGRRGSWQPSKKSVQELEDEINDADEDLPDDASLWNVPLSPRPPSERAAISPTASATASANASPERPSPFSSSYNTSWKHPIPAPRPASAVSAKQSILNHRGSIPNSLGKPRYPRGVSTGTMPDDYAFPKTRAKSWNIALSELSEEAKSLTEALENHAGETENRQQEALQSGRSSTRPSLERLTKAKTSVELPPLRINNVMIDPLPISKEKEKVLSRTRPSWLPPKDKKEEKKHLKEYQRMMELSLEAEKLKAAKEVENQCANDDTKGALLRIWEEHVLPNWDQVIREPRTRELWWRGVAPRSRAKVWEKAIGNELALTENTYAKALERAKAAEARIVQLGKDDLIEEKVWFDAIRRDVEVTFPEINIFQPGGPLHSDLVEVLMAYSMYRSDVGYSHGTHLTAALFCLTLPSPASSFLTLANLLNRPLPLAFLTGSPSATKKAYALTLTLLSHKLPRLHHHLFYTLGLGAHDVLEPMMRTLFLGPNGGVGVETAVRVWDVMIFDGDSSIIRTAVAVLAALESRLYVGKEEVLDLLGWDARIEWRLGGLEEFMARVRSAGKEGKSSK